jgi:hypothetical protein
MSDKTAWSTAVEITIPRIQVVKLYNYCQGQLMKDGVWYKLVPDKKETVIVGKKRFKVTRTQAKKFTDMLRREGV